MPGRNSDTMKRDNAPERPLVDCGLRRLREIAIEMTRSVNGPRHRVRLSRKLAIGRWLARFPSTGGI